MVSESFRSFEAGGLRERSLGERPSNQIGGKKLPSKMVEPNDRLRGFYYAVPPPDGIELDIAVGLADAPRLTLTDQTNGLPDIPGLHIKPRTGDQMPLHYLPAFDSTILVSHSISVARYKSLR